MPLISLMSFFWYLKGKYYASLTFVEAVETQLEIQKQNSNTPSHLSFFFSKSVIVISQWYICIESFWDHHEKGGA